MTERGQLDRRVQKSKDAVLRSTVEILCEHGLGGLSIDEVAARSGVAKTTVYRHWPSRSSLLVDACSQWKEFPVTDTGTLRGDLIALCREIGSLLASPQSSILPSLMDAAERDLEMADVFQTGIGKMTSAFRNVLLRAVKRHELSSSRDIEDLIASIMGPLVYRRWFARKPVTDAFIRKLVDRVALQ